MPSTRRDPRPAVDALAELLARLERTVVASRRERRELVREIEGELREAGPQPRAAPSTRVMSDDVLVHSLRSSASERSPAGVSR